MSRPLGITFALTLAALGTCCGDDGADAGVEAGGGDAGTDGGLDAGRADAGAPDAGGPVVWRPLPGLPAICDVQVAEEPRSALPDLRFGPCPDLGDDECRQVVVDWAEHVEPTHADRFGLLRPTYVDAERSLFTYRRPASRTSEYDYYAIAAASGEHLTVLRSRPPPETQDWCGLGVSALAPTQTGYVLLVVNLIIGDSDAGEAYLLRASYDNPSALTPLSNPGEPTTPRFVQNVEASDEEIGLWTAPPIEIVAVRPDVASAPVTLCPAEPGAPFCNLNDATGPYLLASYDQGGWWIAVAGPGDARFRPLVETTDADDVVSRTDGTDLVWMRGTGPIVAGYRERWELWASAFSDQPSEIAPRLINRLDIRGFNGGIGVGNGRAWTTERVSGNPGMGLQVIHDLTTRERRVYRYPAGEAVGPGRPFLGVEEVGIPVRPDSSLDAKTLRFIRYHALPVEPAPG